MIFSGSARAAIVAGLLAALMGAAVARQVPMNQPGRLPLMPATAASAAVAQTDKFVRQAIVAGAIKHDWQVIEDDPGHIALQVNARSHQVVVDIQYDARSYEIKYRSSVNMNYEKQDGHEYIHPSYNKWVNDLGLAIRAAAVSAGER